MGGHVGSTPNKIITLTYIFLFYTDTRRGEKNPTMNIVTTILLALVGIILMSTVVKALPILGDADDELHTEQLRALADESPRKFKRICGISMVCRPYGGKKRRLGKEWISSNKKLSDVIHPSYNQENYQDY